MAKKDSNPTPQHIADPIPKETYRPEDKLGSDIRIDGKKMKATPPPAPASAASSPAKAKANGGKISSYAKGGMVKSSASKRADGCAQRGKTRA